MTESRKVFITTVLITGIVVLLTTAGTICSLYQTAVKEQEDRLLEFVRNQAEFIEVMHHVVDQEEGPEYKEHGSTESLAEVFSRLSSLHNSKDESLITNSPVLKFYIAEKYGQEVRYHAGPPNLLDHPTPYAGLAEHPMGLALNNQTGSLKTRDHMGNSILCAFTGIEEMHLGIVAKIFLSDLRAPFIKTGVFIYLSALVLFVISGLILKKMVSPLVITLERQRTELETTNQALQNQITKDSLTGLFSRKYFNEHLEQEVLRANRYEIPLSLIFYDIDHFKKINDSFGHLVGDEVLRELSELISSQIRGSDILARWGGEEFVLLCFGADREATSSLAEKLRRHTAEHDFSIRQRVTCSFGVATLSPGETTMAFIDRADRGLYQAKASGRNRVFAM